jgi:hypothetical protein
MLQLGRVSPSYQSALISFHGEHGEKCEGTYRNRLIAVIPIAVTKARELAEKLADTPDKTGHRPGPLAGLFLAYQRICEDLTRTDELQVRALAWETKAMELLIRAGNAWDECARGRQ